jgi:hypothetical protein
MAVDEEKLVGIEKLKADIELRLSTLRTNKEILGIIEREEEKKGFLFRFLFFSITIGLLMLLLLVILSPSGEITDNSLTGVRWYQLTAIMIVFASLFMASFLSLRPSLQRRSEKMEQIDFLQAKLYHIEKEAEEFLEVSQK